MNCELKFLTLHLISLLNIQYLTKLVKLIFKNLFQ